MNLHALFLTLGAFAGLAASQAPVNTSSYISLSKSPPLNASAPIAPAFVSFSIEWAFFPDYAGNRSHPNVYSDNLLSNIAAFQGVKPYIRVGGNTQYVFIPLKE
jgi:hypothetical protein